MGLSHLKFLAEAEEVRFYDDLRDPYFRTFRNEDEDEFSPEYDALVKSPGFPPHLVELLGRRLVAEYQVSRESAPGWAEKWLKENLDLGVLFPSLNTEFLFSGRWLAVPVIVTAEKGFLRYFMAGLVPGGLYRYGPHLPIRQKAPGPATGHRLHLRGVLRHAGRPGPAPGLRGPAPGAPDPGGLGSGLPRGGRQLQKPPRPGDCVL